MNHRVDTCILDESFSSLTSLFNTYYIKNCVLLATCQACILQLVICRLVIIVETTGSKPNHRALIIHMPSMFRTGVRFDDGMLHHVCVTWESSSGALKVYKDGVLVKTLNNVLTGEVIRSGGTWMIGQSQDQERRDRFEGTLVGVNIWNRVLCDYEVERVAEDCGSLIQGNYKSYKDFTMSDTVEFITPSCCPSESQASP